MASEFVGGALLSAFLDPALDRLDSPDDIIDYFKEKKLDFKLLQKLLGKLKSELMSINVVMDDAENKHYTDKNVSRWLRTVKDVVLDVDDLLDEINTEVSMSKLMMQAESQTDTASSEVRSSNFTSNTSLSSFDEELPSRIQDILDNLDDLASQKDILGLVKGTGVSMGKYVPQRVPTTSLVDEAVIYGRDDDKKAIIGLLLSDNDSSGNNLAVISIVGMGGVGKTTLAQRVYNDSKMEEEFQLKAWVFVSEDFNIVRLTKTILEALSVPTNEREDLNLLQVKLKEKLTGKKFLLVLDDVWEENHLKWENLRSPFVYGARGSKILVTTRSEKVASTMRCVHPHQLKQLSEEQSWLLFAKYALCDSNSTSKFEEIGRKIIKKCNGLPLALKAIGSLLYNKSTIEEWNGILTSEIWDISDDIIPALRLSYQYLPPLLKRCFAYCSLIPKNYEFEMDWLVELWMAENFLHVHEQKDMKELGGQYFNDLLLRSFFQKSSRLYPRFVMYDLVNDLVTFISREFCSRLEKEEDAKYVSRMTRHISCIGNYWDNSNQFKPIYKANKLRTLINFSVENISSGMVNDLLGKCKDLRVLSLDDNFDFNFDLCDDFYISYLKHLRYLRFSTGVKKVPASICFLYNLETLYLVRCLYLEELPPLGILPSLKKLSITGNEGIKSIGGEFYGNKSSSAAAAAVPFPSLQFLQFEKMFVWEEWDCQNTSRAFPCLQELLIIECRYLEKLPPLGVSPSLKKLSIRRNEGIKSIGLEFYRNKSSSAAIPFRSLRSLQFEYMTRLEEWDCQNASGAFPSLQELHIKGCNKLKNKLPEHLPSLLKLQISHCKLLVGSLPFAPAIQDIYLNACGNVQLEFPISNTCLETPNVGFPIRHSLNFLQKLVLTGCCHTLEALPLDLFPKLKTLRLWFCRDLERLDGSITSLIQLVIIDCPKLVSLPQGMHTLFPSLTKLSLQSCPEMEWPEGGLPSSLEELEITDCPKLVASQMKWDLHNYTSLTHLRIQMKWDRNYKMVDYKGLIMPPNLKTLNEKEVSRPSSSIQHGLGLP